MAKPGPDGSVLVQATVTADSSVSVAVVDTGVDRNHPDLNIVGGKDFTPDNDFGLDGNGHGTHVSGGARATLRDGSGFRFCFIPTVRSPRLPSG